MVLTRLYLGLSRFGGRQINSHSLIIVIVVTCHVVFLPLTSSASSVPKPDPLALTSSTETNEIDGSGIINTPNRNSSSHLHNRPYMSYLPDNSERLLPIGSLCEKDSNCGNFSVCRLIMSDDTTTMKICDCDEQEMRQINTSCYIKPGHQCYFPNKNAHGYYFIECLPGSVCTSSVNRSAAENGYCMCKKPRVADHYRVVNVDFEMATCASSRISMYLSFYSVVIAVCILVTFQLRN